PEIRVRLQERCGGGLAGVVHENIDGARPRTRTFECMRDRNGVSDIRLRIRQLPGFLKIERTLRLWLGTTAKHGDARAVIQQGARDGGADSPRPSGDDGMLAAQEF